MLCLRIWLQNLQKSIFLGHSEICGRGLEKLESDDKARMRLFVLLFSFIVFHVNIFTVLLTLI